MMRLDTISIAAALIVCLILGGALWLQAGTIKDLRGENATLELSVAALERQRRQAEQAYAEADAVAAQGRAREAALRQRIETVLTTDYGGCADAQIDPALLDTLGGGLVPGPR